VARQLLFSGKGGVGKTTLACAAAVHFAQAGLRTLVVTTDPASNVSDVFEQRIGEGPVPIRGLDGLFASELDADSALRAYKARALAPLEGVLPDDVLRSLDEQMSGPCTSEIAAFDQFVARVDDQGFDRVVFDTAPTGHTLRLLELPGAWVSHIDAVAQVGGQTCLGPADALAASREQYERALESLRSPRSTAVILVTQAERTAVEETERAHAEMVSLGIAPRMAVVNGRIPAEVADNAFARARRAMQDEQIAELSRRVPIPIVEVPLLDSDVTGIKTLGRLGDHLAPLLELAAV
jgi:arsenite-transporting ATPase